MTTSSPTTSIQNFSVLIAALMLGVMAGFFWTYSFNVNYATAMLDRDTYTRVQSLLNQNVRHSMFFIFFFGSAVATAMSVLINICHWRSISFWLIVFSLALYSLGIIAYTKFVNLPLNAYTESWIIGSVPSDWEEIRNDWNSANLFRVFTSSLAFGLCGLALAIRASVRR